MRIVNQIIIIVCAAFVFCRSALPELCQNCLAPLQELKKEMQLQAMNQELLKKNMEYLNNYGKVSPSGRVKAKSNVFIITLRLEAAKNNIAAINSELTQKGCGACPRN